MFSSHRYPQKIRRLRTSIVWAFGLFALLSWQCVQAQGETLTLETWRGDDTSHWINEILPAFNRTHPNIKVRITPTVPTRYDKVLEQKLATGKAGDLITCRPFDQSLDL